MVVRVRYERVLCIAAHGVCIYCVFCFFVKLRKPNQRFVCLCFLLFEMGGCFPRFIVLSIVFLSFTLFHAVSFIYVLNRRIEIRHQETSCQNSRPNATARLVKKVKGIGRRHQRVENALIRTIIDCIKVVHASGENTRRSQFAPTTRSHPSPWSPTLRPCSSVAMNTSGLAM